MSERGQPDPARAEATESDAALLQRARKDPRAFDAIYVRHARQIHGWLAAQVGDQLAWELTAETFAQAWIGRKRFRADGPDSDGSAGPWLHGIARNLLRQWARSQRIERSAVERLRVRFDVTSDPDEDDELERIIAGMLGSDLAESLQRLPPDQRLAIELRVVDQRPYDEIARQLACTPDVVRMRVMRGLRALHADLQGLHP